MVLLPALHLRLLLRLDLLFRLQKLKHKSLVFSAMTQLRKS